MPISQIIQHGTFYQSHQRLVLNA